VAAFAELDGALSLDAADARIVDGCGSPIVRHTESMADSIPNYSRVLFHDGEAWNVSVPELNGATTFGNTPEHALAMADDMVAGIIEMMIAEGDPLPPPIDNPITVEQAS